MHGWGPPWSFRYYLLIDVEDESDYIAATFLPYFIAFGPDYDDSIIWSIGFSSLAQDGHSFNLVPEGQPPFDFTINPAYYLSYVHLLPFPQEELETLTVVFRREAATGNLVAVSSRYNANS